MALAADVPDVLLAVRDGPARPRHRRSSAMWTRMFPARSSQRTRHALTELDPASNPVRALDPHRHARGRAAVRPARGELRHHSRQSRPAGVALRVARGVPRVDPTRARFDRFNLSDVFEYVSPEHYERTLEVDRRLQPAGRPARLLEHARAAPASAEPGRAPAAAGRPGRRAARTDRAFFYSAFRLEEVQ